MRIKTYKNISDSKGFTFIELMVAITILGIISAIAIPNYPTGYLRRVYIIEGLILSESVRKKIIDYYEFTGRFPSDNKSIGLPHPGAIRGKYTESIAVKDGQIDIRLNQSIHEESRGKILTIRPAIVEDNPTGPVVWIVGDKDVPPGMKVFGTNNSTIRF